MSKVTLPLSGGCQCGRHRYLVTALPLTLYACHCTECQRQSGGAFGLSMPVARTAIEGDLARLESWSRNAASGRKVGALYCGSCGTRLFHEPSRNPDIVNLKPGTLDDTSWIDPVAHLWLASAQPWFRPPDGALTFSSQPASFDDLFKRFSDRYDSAASGA